MIKQVGNEKVEFHKNNQNVFVRNKSWVSGKIKLKLRTHHALMSPLIMDVIK